MSGEVEKQIPQNIAMILKGAGKVYQQQVASIQPPFPDEQTLLQREPLAQRRDSQIRDDDSNQTVNLSEYFD